MPRKSRYKYTDEQIEEAVKVSESIADVARKLGIRVAGGAQLHIRRRVKRLGLDTSHFTPHTKFLQTAWEHNKKHWSEKLVYREGKDVRQNGRILRQALIESGRPYCCADCGIDGMWRGKPLTLEVDHKNRDWLDDRPENLDFVCPNCHTQRGPARVAKREPR